MPLDGFTLSLLTKEISKAITGNRIEKIHQPTKDEIIFHLRSKDGTKKLYFSTSSDNPRLYLATDVPENPSTPPMLCMFLRKHLTGCIITEISQPGFERIITFNVSGTNEIGDPVSFRIVFEVMAKHSNFIILNDDGIILEATRKSDYTPASGRSIQPGFKYLLPPSQNKHNILSESTDEICNIILSNERKRLSDSILFTVEGASPLISREISSAVSGNDIFVSELSENQKLKLHSKLNELINILVSGGTPTLLLKENSKPFDISFTDICQYGFSVTAEKFDSYSKLMEKFFTQKRSVEKSNQQSKELYKLVLNLYQRSLRKYEVRSDDLEKCKGKEELRINAELILACQYNLKKGSLYFDVPDYYNSNEIKRIKADPALSPSDNAQKYFKEYNKLKNAEKLLDSLIEESKIEIKYLESVLDNISRSIGYSDIAEIREELYNEGYLKRNRKQKESKVKPLPPIKYISDDGYIIYAGRNNIQNEKLSFKTGAKNDSWFHTQSFPGSHVIVIGNGDILPERTCRQAAVIAACNSSAGDSSKVAVDYTEIRELKKPKNGKPGMVFYHTYNTMWVEPDKELCERLQSK